MCLNPPKIEIDLFKITKLTLLVADSGGGALGRGGVGVGLNSFTLRFLKVILNPSPKNFCEFLLKEILLLRGHKMTTEGVLKRKKCFKRC